MLIYTMMLTLCVGFKLEKGGYKSGCAVGHAQCAAQLLSTRKRAKRPHPTRGLIVLTR